MKAITVKQPWASLICSGIKDIENRTWKTNFRGRVLIHAGKGKQYSIHQLLSIDQKRAFEKAVGYEYDFNKMFPKGAIIGSVEIVGCIINHPSIWAEKTEGVTDINTGEFIPKRNPKAIYNWVLANPIKFPEPLPAKGKLSFWEFDQGSEFDNMENL